MNVSEGFARVIERMIEPAPEDRFGSAGELLDTLDGASDVLVHQASQVVGATTAQRALAIRGACAN